MIVIKAMIGKSYPKGSKLKNVISGIKQEMNSFVQISLFHIKGDLNEEANHWAKQVTEFNPDTLVQNEIYDFRVIP